jgi:hypothetical protein
MIPSCIVMLLSLLSLPRLDTRMSSDHYYKSAAWPRLRAVVVAGGRFVHPPRLPPLMVTVRSR